MSVRVSSTYRICLRIVIANKAKKYMTRMGQYTGISKATKKEQTKEINVDFVADNLVVGS